MSMVPFGFVRREAAPIDGDIGCAQGRAMNPGTYDSVRDEAVVAWLDDATEHARANAQAKLLYCLECVRYELIEMKHEAGLATPPWSRKD